MPLLEDLGNEFTGNLPSRILIALASLQPVASVPSSYAWLRHNIDDVHEIPGRLTFCEFLSDVHEIPVHQTKLTKFMKFLSGHSEPIVE